jgi:cyclophilin family peptidyl-prolyl cis-trans isomerase/HEAT repeat protein
MRLLLLPLFAIVLLAPLVYTQRLVSPVVGNYRVSDADLIAIVKAEDARDAGSVIAMLTNANAAVRYRAALAAGRIGDEKALDGLIKLLTDGSVEVRAMAAFAIGEVESIKAADAVLAAINVETKGSWNMAVLARLIEAAGKIAAANPKEGKSKELGKAIFKVMDGQAISPSPADGTLVRLGLTALLRTRPEGADVVTAKFLTETDPRLRADAGNTLTRLKAKNANSTLRKMLVSDADAVARANAARALGAAEDKDAVNILLDAVAKDVDSRVRVSAIRAVGSLKDAKAADRLMERGETLEAAYKRSKFRAPVEQNELIEIATVLGRLLAGTANARAMKLLGDLALLDDARNPEFSIARLKVNPDNFDNSKRKGMTWREMSIGAQVMAELATIEPKTDEAKKMKAESPALLKDLIALFSKPGAGDDKLSERAIPDVLQAYAAFKPADLDNVLRASLQKHDVIIRATAAGLLADRRTSKENVEALRQAFSDARENDKHDNDAQLAILDAMFKLDKKSTVPTLLYSLSMQDYLVRKKALELLDDPELIKDSPGIKFAIDKARNEHKDRVLPYDPKFGTKLGQVLNTTVDYRRALSRRNGSVKAVLTTEKGTFTIVFNPEEAPLTVDNFVKLARSRYFNGLEVHRVVPNFVMQDGDPRGDGNGGPGWSIRCEVNMLSYDRGAVGMALSGKDTGGSQWFVTHSPQPHLDGGYTVFGHVSEADMKVADSIVRGDKIINVRIIGR